MGRRSSSSEQKSRSQSSAEKKRHKEDKSKLKKSLKKQLKKEKNKSSKHSKRDKSEKNEKNEKKKGKKKVKYGKYGTIGQTDLHQRREEFMMWLSEVKCINIETLSQPDERRYFDEYVECYNTATLPSKKYYNFKIWFEKEKQRSKSKNQDVEMSVFDDEAQKKKEQIEYKQMLKNQRIKDQYQTLHECQELAQEAQERQQLQELMRHQYLLGNHEEAQKIYSQLQPKRQVIVSGDTSSSEY